MGEKVKRYKIIDSHKELALSIEFPQFILETQKNDIFGSENVL